jgi:CheY-like chemotaxis protein
MGMALEEVPRGSETILLVEPDPETRKLAAFMLSKQGYTVLEARNAAEAF